MNDWVTDKLDNWLEQVDEDRETPDEMLLADFLLGKLNENRVNVTKKEWKEYLDMMGVEID